MRKRRELEANTMMLVVSTVRTRGCQCGCDGLTVCGEQVRQRTRLLIDVENHSQEE